jgi:hypothetical protein
VLYLKLYDDLNVETIVFAKKVEDDMKSMQTTATASVDGKLTVQLPPSITPGEHHVLLIIDDGAAPSKARIPTPPLALNVLRWEAWPADSTFRREDIYGDGGR